jgi:hypothetical protein
MPAGTVGGIGLIEERDIGCAPAVIVGAATGALTTVAAAGVAAVVGAAGMILGRVVAGVSAGVSGMRDALADVVDADVTVPCIVKSASSAWAAARSGGRSVLNGSAATRAVSSFTMLCN